MCVPASITAIYVTPLCTCLRFFERSMEKSSLIYISDDLIWSRKDYSTKLLYSCHRTKTQIALHLPLAYYILYLFLCQFVTFTETNDYSFARLLYAIVKAFLFRSTTGLSNIAMYTLYFITLASLLLNNDFHKEISFRHEFCSNTVNFCLFDWCCVNDLGREF